MARPANDAVLRGSVNDNLVVPAPTTRSALKDFERKLKFFAGTSAACASVSVRLWGDVVEDPPPIPAQGLQPVERCVPGASRPCLAGGVGSFEARSLAERLEKNRCVAALPVIGRSSPERGTRGSEPKAGLGDRRRQGGGSDDLVLMRDLPGCGAEVEDGEGFAVGDPDEVSRAGELLQTAAVARRRASHVSFVSFRQTFDMIARQRFGLAMPVTCASFGGLGVCDPPSEELRENPAAFSGLPRRRVR